MLVDNLGIERLLVVVNPHSTNFDRVQSEVIDRVIASDWARRSEIVETVNPTLLGKDNIQHIAESLVPNQAIIIAGGDGLVNDVGNSVDSVEDGIRDSSYCLVRPHGCGNDTARSLNGGKGKVDIFDVLATGDVREIDLIDVEIGNTKKVAVSYMGIGWTALGSEAINRPEKRQQKMNHRRISHKVFDGITLSGVLAGERFRPSFKYFENDGGVREASEILFSNLPSMAGGAITVEKSTPGHVVCIEIEPDNFLTEIMKRLALQKFTGGMKGAHITGRSIVVDAGTMIHLDGEFQRLEEPTPISVGVKPNRLNFLVKA